MLSRYEWYRRWRGGYYDLEKKCYTFVHRWDNVNSICLASWNEVSSDPRYTVHYPGRGAKPRMRVYAKYGLTIPWFYKSHAQFMSVRNALDHAGRERLKRKAKRND